MKFVSTRPLLLIAVCLMLIWNAIPAIGQDRVDDSKKNQLLVIGNPEGMPAKWFASNPNLEAVVAVTQFSVLDPNKKEHAILIGERYVPPLGNEFPIVALLRPDGGVIYAADRHSMPPTSEKLYQEMKASVLAAKNAVKAPAMRQLETFTDFAYSASDESWPDEYGTPITGPCVNGKCKPLLRPDADPFAEAGSIFSSVSALFWLVVGVVILGFVFVCSCLVAFVLYLTNRTGS